MINIPTPTPPRQLRNKIAQLEKDNRDCNTKVSKLLLIVEGLLVGLNSAANTIADHQHNDSALRRERVYLEILIDKTNEGLIKL